MTRDARRARRSAAAAAPPPQPARPLRERIPADRLRDVLILAALATVLYVNSFGAGLIVDSQTIIVQDPRVHAVKRENLASILTQDYLAGRGTVSGVYRPVTTLSYLANYAVLGNGTSPTGYHAVNLLLHIVNAVLVYLLAGMLLRNRVYALCIAAIFTAHPIATEAVTNVIGRADLLAASAVLGATALYIRSITAAGPAKRRGLIAVGVVTLLGLLSKESAVAIVGVVLAYDLTYRIRSSEPGRAPGELLAEVGECFWTGWIALVPALVVVGLVRWRIYAGTVVRPPSFVDNPLVGADFWSARLTALKVLGRSVALLVWPRTLSWDYSYDQIPLVRWPLQGWDDWQAVLALVGLVAAVVVAGRSRRRAPALCFFVLFGLVTMVPTSNLIVLFGSIMAERFLYLPLVAFAACVVLAVAAVTERIRPQAATVATAAVVGILVVVLGARTIVRNRDWRDEVQLAQSGIEAAPRSAKVYLAYASALSHRDGLDGADVEVMIAHAEQALAIMDERPLPAELQESNVPLLLGMFYKTKGTQLARRGDDGRPWYLRAQAMLDRALEIQTAQNEQYRRLSLERGLREDQIAEIGGYELPYHLGDVHMLLGEPAKAVEEFARVRRLAPLAAQTHVSVARAAMATNDLERAVRSLTIAVALGGRDAKTQGLLVDAYRQLDPHGCSVKDRGDHAELDGTCPFVRTHLCAAYVELVELSIDAQQWYLGRRVGEAAIRTGECDAAPFERLLARIGEQAP